MSGPRKVNILLVDDQPARLLSYESILSDLGQNLICARSGLEALEKLMQDDFAVVLLDVSMPGMDGFETASLIHDHPRFEKTPIIFVTGVHVTEFDRLKGYKLGAVDYVYIPVIPEILRSKVAVLVELHLQRQELRLLNRTLAEAHERLSQAHSALQAEKTRELEDLNRTLREANRHKDEFLAMLAHELRNPLAPIRNAVQLMSQRPQTDPQIVWSREIIERQLGHLTRLVDDLLDVSRITRGKINVAREPVDVALVVTRAIETVQPVLTEMGHQLTLQMIPEPVFVTGDLTRLTQALGNVLSNAAKYTEAGGRIALEVRADDVMVEIRVRDSGIGIAPESLPTVFELFTQLKQTEHGQHGLGIGLALVKKLVELHDGEITAHSEGPGKGSEFLIRLPRRFTVAPMRPQAPQQPFERVLTSRRILIADDNNDALESLSVLLQLEGHEVYTAADGAQAVEQAGRHQPEVALLDIGMPKLNGYDVARKIRSEPWGKKIVLVALTGWGQENDRRLSREAGFDSHLVKPLEPQVLTDFLARLPLQPAA